MFRLLGIIVSCKVRGSKVVIAVWSAGYIIPCKSQYRLLDLDMQDFDEEGSNVQLRDRELSFKFGERGQQKQVTFYV